MIARISEAGEMACKQRVSVAWRQFDRPRPRRCSELCLEHVLYLLCCLLRSGKVAAAISGGHSATLSFEHLRSYLPPTYTPVKL